MKKPIVTISNTSIINNPVSEETIIIARAIEAVAKAAQALAERVKAPVNSYGIYIEGDGKVKEP